MNSETHTELARRTSDGLDVRLIWSRRTDTLFVSVRDERLGGTFAFEVANRADALEAFRHPFAYAAWTGDDDELPAAA